MRKVLGLSGLLLALVVLTTLWESSRGDGQVTFLTTHNIRNLTTWIGLYGILSIAQSLVIITGGIDLSVGSLMALVGISSAMLMNKGMGMHPAFAIPLALGIGTLVGTWHGLLVTKLRLQPFIVTLCGLFLYRGIARFISEDQSKGFGNAFPNLRWFGNGYIGDFVGVPFVIMIVLAILVGAYLHFTPGGRHLFALGANEESARFSGIRTQRAIMAAYIMCGTITGVGAILLAFKVGSLGSSDFGNFYELYAIAGAVLGGCSLRGGSGNIIGVLIGAALLKVLSNLVNILESSNQLEYVVIGAAILIGVAVDELLTRRKRVA